MLVKVKKDQIIEIYLYEFVAEAIIEGKKYRENIEPLQVAMYNNAELDEEFSWSLIRKLWQITVGVDRNKYKVCLDYEFDFKGEML